MRVQLAGEDHVLSLLKSKAKMRLALADTKIPKLVLSLMAGHPYRLVSYWYVRPLGADAPAMLRRIVEDPSNLIMDSGLFSLMFGSEKGTLPSTYEAYRDYTRRYLDDVARWDVPCTIVESDTHRLLGMDATLRLREEFAPLGDRVIYVWHQPEGLDGLVKLARERSYIALSIPELRMISSGGSVAGNSSRVQAMCGDLLRRIHAACGNQPPRVHLLGCTVEAMMQTHLAWSCDSTSWLSGIRFGSGLLWTSRGLKQAHVRSPRFLAYQKVAIANAPVAAEWAAKQSNPRYYLDCLTCAFAYTQYQKWLDTQFAPVPMRGAVLPGGPVR